MKIVPHLMKNGHYLPFERIDSVEVCLGLKQVWIIEKIEQEDCPSS